MKAIDLIDGIIALTHPKAELLYDLVLGRLSPERASAVTDHLDVCRHCRVLAERLGWSPVAEQTAEVVRLPMAGGLVEPRRRDGQQGRPLNGVGRDRPKAAWRAARLERMAASDGESPRSGSTDDGADGTLVQLIPGATDGDVTLGYLCSGGADVVVTGAGDRTARVHFGGVEYEVRDGPADEPRVVEGLTRRHVAMWLAGRRQGRFAMVYP